MVVNYLLNNWSPLLRRLLPSHSLISLKNYKVITKNNNNKIYLGERYVFRLPRCESRHTMGVMAGPNIEIDPFQ